MYIEYACYHKVLLDEVKLDVFKALELGAKGISVPLSRASHICPFLEDGIVLSCPIDYPTGQSDRKVRTHAAVRASNYGATAIDLVANAFLFFNKEEEFADELKGMASLCKDKGMTFRVMTDHRKFGKIADFVHMLNIIKDCGAEYVFVSTGHVADDPIDNAILCYGAQKQVGIPTISNGNLYLPKHVENLAKKDIFGIRFNNITALKRCGMVYNT